MDKKAIGFNAEVVSKSSRDVADVLKEVTAQDLVKYGLIPEFVGRVPISISLDGLDEDALVKILTEPKNALVKQYQRMFSMDGVELTFTKEAIERVAKEAEERKTGARALRSIIEEAILDVMFELPSMDNVRKCIVDEEVIEKKAKPKLVYASDLSKEPKKSSKSGE